MFFENLMCIYIFFVMVEKKLGLIEIFFDVFYFLIKKGEIFYDICLILDVLGVDLMVIWVFENDYYLLLINLGVGYYLGLGIVNGGDGFG